MSDCTVLLVDDEVDFVEVLSDRLEARGLSVVKAHSGEQALAAAEGKVFDAIVLDMAMPGMDGLETLEGLLNINPDLQVILLTGKATLEQAATAIRIGALDLMEKPAAIDTLVSKIEMAATRRWSLEEKRIELKVADIMRKKGW
ncbi:MAG: response regulator [Gemmatimonadota bacterium]